MGFPDWSPTKRSLTWENGAQVQFFSAEEPERLRGPQFESAWCDELAAWNKDDDTWAMLQFCMRLGKHPRITVTTTPKPTKLITTHLERIVRLMSLQVLLLITLLTLQTPTLLRLRNSMKEPVLVDRNSTLKY
jgi:phage terminase large subunit-like protein